MKRAIALCALITVCASCASRPGPHVSLAVMADQTAQTPKLIKIIPDDRPDSRELQHCAYRIKGRGADGVQRDFSAICGPIGCPLPADLKEWYTSTDPKGEIKEPGQPTLGPDMQWSVEAGYVVLWGWWPLAISPTVRIGTEGRGVAMVIVDASNAREIVIHLGVDTTTIQDRNNPKNNRDLTRMNEFVEISRDAKGVVTIGTPAIIEPGSALDEFVNDVLSWKARIEA